MQECLPESSIIKFIKFSDLLKFKLQTFLAISTFQVIKILSIFPLLREFNFFTPTEYSSEKNKRKLSGI